MGNEMLSVVIIGEVDHGKSSLIGRLLTDMNAIPISAVEKVKEICKCQGHDFEHAFLLDAFEEEQRDAATLDTCQICFASARRRYRLIDAPGHFALLKNMVSGSVLADVAVLVVDVQRGMEEQTRRHLYLAKFLGIANVVVVVNKMDMVGFQQHYFATLVTQIEKYLASLAIEPLACIPVSAKTGANLASREAATSWYSGTTLMETLDRFVAADTGQSEFLRFAVQDVYVEQQERIVAGRVESGRIAAGDEIRIWPAGTTAHVAAIRRWQAALQNEVGQGESIGIVVQEDAAIVRGNVLAHPGNAPQIADALEANVLWMGKEPLTTDTPLILKLMTQSVDCRIAHIEAIIDMQTLLHMPPVHGAMTQNQIGSLRLKTAQPIAVDLFRDFRKSGRFVLTHNGVITGGGIVTSAIGDRSAAPVSANIAWEFSQLTARQRAALNGHHGAVVWLTGLPASGKSTIAKALEARLFCLGCRAYVLDGDNLRHGLNADLDFSAPARSENIRRAGEVAKLFCQAGLIAVTAFISPIRKDRDRARSIVEQDRFFEVYLACPLEICEKRDPKGHYRKARAGEISAFTGISSPYEEPSAPELVLHTERMSVCECVEQIVALLKSKNIFLPAAGAASGLCQSSDDA